MALTVGQLAPDFALKSSDGDTVSLLSLRGSLVVIYFYPRDNTPGCTIEAEAFRDASPTFAKLGAGIFGVSKDSIASHCKFRDKFKLNFPLLSDPDGTMLAAYGAWGQKVMYGKSMLGIIRSTVLIGEDGRVLAHWPKVSVKGHVDEVLAAVRAARGQGAPAATTPAAKPAAKKPAAKKPAATEPERIMCAPEKPVTVTVRPHRPTKICA